MTHMAYSIIKKYFLIFYNLPQSTSRFSHIRPLIRHRYWLAIRRACRLNAYAGASNWHLPKMLIRVSYERVSNFSFYRATANCQALLSQTCSHKEACPNPRFASEIHTSSTRLRVVITYPPTIQKQLKSQDKGTRGAAPLKVNRI